MISEISFATQRASLWHILAPSSERFVRRINLNVERYDFEHELADAPARRGFLNEIAFQCARLKLTTNTSAVEEATRTARENFRQLDRSKNESAELTSEEVRTVAVIEESLVAFVQKRTTPSTSVIFEPAFPGCGLLNASFGDLLIDDTLYEVKAGDRQFRSTDLRQLITYCAMNFSAKKYQIIKAGFVNPRRGIYFVLDLDTIANEIAGKSSAELFSDIIYFLSDSGISR